MPTNVNWARESDALVWTSKLKAGGQPRYFQSKTGGARSAGSSIGYDGGSKIPEVTTEPATTANIVTQIRYKPAIDHEVIKYLRSVVGSYVDTLNVLDTDEDFRPIPGVTPDVFPNAVLVEVGGIDVDRNGTGVRTCDLTWAVSAEA
jgi:hypothetical protein